MEHITSQHHIIRAEARAAILWSQMLPHNEFIRFKVGIIDWLSVWFALLEHSSRLAELVYNADINRIVVWCDDSDMIIKGEHYPVVKKFWDFNLVILERDRNRYGLFHRSLDTRLKEYGVEF